MVVVYRWLERLVGATILANDAPLPAVAAGISLVALDLLLLARNALGSSTATSGHCIRRDCLLPAKNVSIAAHSGTGGHAETKWFLRW